MHAADVRALDMRPISHFQLPESLLQYVFQTLKLLRLIHFEPVQFLHVLLAEDLKHIPETVEWLVQELKFINWKLVFLQDFSL